MDQIEVWPVMGRLAIALRETVIFRFWCLLLHLARKQAGGRRINNVTLGIDDLHICDVFSARTMRRYLDKAVSLGYVRGFVPLGDNVWRVYFTGQKRMAANLQVRAESAKIMNSDEWDRRKLFIGFAEFAQITKFSGAIFASWIAVAIDHERRATWEYLCKMWGVSRQAIEAWIAADGSIRRFENWAVTRVPYMLFDESQWHGQYNDHTGNFHIQRGNTYAVENANARFAAQGQIWQINGVAGQSILSTDQRGNDSDASPLISRHTRHSARPIQNDPDAPSAAEMRTNFTKPRAFSKRRNRQHTSGLYLLTAEVVSLSRFGKARRIWHYSPPMALASNLI